MRSLDMLGADVADGAEILEEMIEAERRGKATDDPSEDVDDLVYPRQGAPSFRASQMEIDRQDTRPSIYEHYPDMAMLDGQPFDQDAANEWAGLPPGTIRVPPATRRGRPEIGLTPKGPVSLPGVSTAAPAAPAAPAPASSMVSSHGDSYGYHVTYPWWSSPYPYSRVYMDDYPRYAPSSGMNENLDEVEYPGDAIADLVVRKLMSRGIPVSVGGGLDMLGHGGGHGGHGHHHHHHGFPGPGHHGWWGPGYPWWVSPLARQPIEIDDGLDEEAVADLVVEKISRMKFGGEGVSVGGWFSSDRPKLPSEVDVSAMRGPGGRALTADEQRYSRAYKAFSLLAQQWKDKNPSFGTVLDPMVAFQRRLNDDYVQYVTSAAQYPESEDLRASSARGVRTIADAMEALFARTHETVTGTNNAMLDVKDDVQRAAFLNAMSQLGEKVREGGAALLKPLRDLGEGTTDILKAVPWLVGAALLVAGVVGGIYVWRGGSVAALIARRGV